MAQILIESGEGKGRRFRIGKIAIIGRLKSCDIPIKDPKASRNNTKISATSQGFVVEDLDSSNGTLLNGKRVDRGRLRSGDRIKIGKTVLLFRHAPARATPTEPKTEAPSKRPAAEPEQAPPKPSTPSHTPAPASAGTDPKDREALANLSTPPEGVPAAPLPSTASEPEPATGEGEEDVEELDLGGEPDEAAPPEPSAPAAPARPAPVTSPSSKPSFTPRIPLERTSPPREGSRSPLLEDLSQRSAAFRALIYAGVVALMVLLCWAAFTLASGAF